MKPKTHQWGGHNRAQITRGELILSLINNGFNREKAAADLGVSRATLFNHMREMRLRVPPKKRQ